MIRKSRLPFYLFVFISIFSFGIVLTLTLWYMDSLTVLGLTEAFLVIILSLMPLILGICRGQLDILELGVLYGVMFAVCLGLPAFIHILAPHFPNRLRYSTINDIILALTVSLLALIGLWAGYYSPFGVKLARRLPLLHSDWLSRIKLNQVSLIFFIGLVAKLAPITQESIGPFYGVLTYTKPLLIGGMSLAFVWGLQGYLFRMGRWFIVIGFASVALWFMAASGSKFDIIMWTLALLIPFYYPKRLISNKLVFPFFLILLVFILPILEYSYSFSRSNLKMEQRQAYVTAAREWPKLSGNEISDKISYMLLIRFNRLQDVVEVQRKHPSLWPFRWGSTIWKEAKIGLIPRFLWKGKPILDTGGWYGNLYFNMPNNICADLPPSAELYMNFGYFGIIPGMFMIGIALRILWQWARAGGTWPPLHIMTYGLLLATIVFSVGNPFMTIFSILPRTAFILVAVFLLLRILSHPRGHINS